MNKKRMIVFMPLILMPEQDVIRKAFIRDVINKAKEYDIDFCICIKKELKYYEEQGILKALSDNGINIVDLSKRIKMDDMSVIIRKSDMEEIARPYDILYVIGLLHRSCKGLYQKAYNCVCSSDDEVIVSGTYASSLSMLKRIIPAFYIMNEFSPVVWQYCVDWMEFSLINLEQEDCKIIQYGHYANHNKYWYCTHYPMYENYLKEQLARRVDKSKPIDFIFGYTATDLSRKPLSDKIKEIMAKMPDVEIYARDSYRDVKNTIPQSQYLNRVAKSKVSLIVPSYDKNEFSWMRLCEYVYAECLPIVCVDDDRYEQYKASMAGIFRTNGWEELYKFISGYNMIRKFSEVDDEVIAVFSTLYSEIMPQLAKEFQKVVYKQSK